MTVPTVIRTGLALPAEAIVPLMTTTGDSLHRVDTVRVIVIASVLLSLCVETIMTVMGMPVVRHRVPGWMTIRLPLRAVPMMRCMMRVLPCRRRGLMTPTWHLGLLLDVLALLPGASICRMSAVHTGRCIAI